VSDLTTPIEISVTPISSKKPQFLRTFSSYSFERNILVPASPFRFTAEGVDPAVRMAIRSADTVELYAKNSTGTTYPVATGYIDETDTHITPTSVEYVLTGRDTIGQLVDNAAVDANNTIIHLASINLKNVALTVIQNTRIPPSILPQNLPDGLMLFQTNPGETKINVLQRYMEYTNCLVWSAPNGQMVIGKPNMSQPSMGNFILKSTGSNNNNLLEARVRRNTNMAIRKIAVQLQTLNITDPSNITVTNGDPDVVAVAQYRAGKSVYRTFSLGNGTDAVNQLTQVGSGGSPQQIGFTLSRKEVAKSNMDVLEIEAVVLGHFNEQGQLYNIDQVYHVVIDDENVAEDMYVHTIKYDLTKDRGMITTMRLSRLGTVVADVTYTNAYVLK
jgi:prophage tail gpP-like protein